MESDKNYERLLNAIFPFEGKKERTHKLIPTLNLESGIVEYKEMNWELMSKEEIFQISGIKEHENDEYKACVDCGRLISRMEYTLNNPEIKISGWFNIKFCKFCRHAKQLEYANKSYQEKKERDKRGEIPKSLRPVNYSKDNNYYEEEKELFLRIKIRKLENALHEAKGMLENFMIEKRGLQ